VKIAFKNLGNTVFGNGVGKSEQCTVWTCSLGWGKWEGRNCKSYFVNVCYKILAYTLPYTLCAIHLTLLYCIYCVHTVK
jgi:hypothetical protein